MLENIIVTNKQRNENTLTEIIQKLKNLNIELTKSSNDGRVNSAIDEDLIVKKIQDIHNLSLLEKHDCINIKTPDSREWFDFSMGYKDGSTIPVNIKISNGISADNLNCKLGLYYALTGLTPQFKNTIGWKKFFELLKRDLNINNEMDYYFLIIIKSDFQKSFWTSLKRIKKLVPNGNNLPFQCSWLDNTDITEKTAEESYAYLMQTLTQSAKLRSVFETELHNNFHEENKKFAF